MTPGRYQLTLLDRETREAQQVDCAGVLALTALDPQRFMVSIRGLDAPALSMAAATLLDRLNDLDDSIVPMALARLATGMTPSVGAVLQYPNNRDSVGNT